MSNESKHTPAPWVINLKDKFLVGDFLYITDANDKVICKVSHDLRELHVREYEANASIIQNAPKMYEALVAIRAIQNGEWDNPILQKYGSIPVNTEDLIAEIATEALK